MSAIFSGVVRVSRGDEVLYASAEGLAHRALGLPNTLDTRFAIASGSKIFTALAVLSLVADGTLSYDTTARSLLRSDLPLIRDDVTIRHLLAHRSGIGDYLDEEDEGDISDYVLTVPVHRLVGAEDFLPLLDGFATVSAPDERFAYNNGGYVVLALLAERASGVPYHDLVAARVFAPAGLAATAYLRSDELPGDAALGYLTDDGPRTNVLHLPVRGGGDGGCYSTAADIAVFWRALFAGAIVPPEVVAEATRPHSEGYGLGFELVDGCVQLEGYDAGVSFRSSYDPTSGLVRTVVSNTSEGAWPRWRALQSRTF